MWNYLFELGTLFKKGKPEMSTDLAAAFRSPFASSAKFTKKVEDDKDKDKDKDKEGDEGLDEDEDLEDQPEDNDEKKKKKSKKRGAEDEEDEKDDDKPEARAARAREKRRIKAIVNSHAGQRFPGAAMRVALDTSLPRWSAVAMLSSLTSDLLDAGRVSLRDRMAGVEQPNVGTDGGNPPDGTTAMAAAIIRAGQKARGEI
jgi:hypothetical protein